MDEKIEGGGKGLFHVVTCKGFWRSRFVQLIGKSKDERKRGRREGEVEPT